MENTVKQKVEEHKSEIPHADMDLYPNENGYEWDFRAIIDGKHREDTRSRVLLDKNGNINMLMIRLPNVKNAEEMQDDILLIARRKFGRRSGCYGRSGNLHVKYPTSNELVNYTISDFVKDYKRFKDEVEQKIDFQD